MARNQWIRITQAAYSEQLLFGNSIDVIERPPPAGMKTGDSCDAPLIRHFVPFVPSSLPPFQKALRLPHAGSAG
jgi:hypothetical protein